MFHFSVLNRIKNLAKRCFFNFQSHQDFKSQDKELIKLQSFGYKLSILDKVRFVNHEPFRRFYQTLIPPLRLFLGRRQCFI